jgi:hypothetical protein
MKRIDIFFIVFLSLSSFQQGFARSAVTYTFGGGRFGDNLLSYSRAKYIACLYDIPLLYIPFPYSNSLMMHNLEQHFSREKVNEFKAVVSYKQVNGIIDPEADILYVVPFFPESVYERNCPRNPYLFDVDWDNPKLKQELQKMIKPQGLLNLQPIPSDCVTVALHVRVGTGFDLLAGHTYDDMIKWHPFKWPPLSFYIESLHLILNQFPDQKIYAYIFTDHDNPAEIMNYFTAMVGSNRIQFECRLYGNRHDANVLEDFFSLLQFECLIRSDSHFSLIAEKIANYKVLIAPKHVSQQNGITIIDEIIFLKRG